jgi:hypothetical protein
MDVVKTLIAQMQQMPVIDAHEHLPGEAAATAATADVFTRIYCHYSLTNAFSAGLRVARDWIRDTGVPLEKRWKAFRPFLGAIRDTGYARAAQIAACELYGIEDINDDTYEELSDRLQEANKPGLFGSVLKDKCRIERVLNQGGWVDEFAPQISRDFCDIEWANPEQLREKLSGHEQRSGAAFFGPEEWLDWWCAMLVETKHPGIKIVSALPGVCVERSEAARLFAKLRDGGLDQSESRELGVYLVHGALARAGTVGLVVAVHCGIIWECWQDFSRNHPRNMVPLLRRYRDTTFDLYHGGMPWVREMAVIGNQYPNAHLNLVWCHQISPYMTEQMLNEWVDLVPLNKISGFGGDNCDGPEKTYGVLRMTQENIARALAVRVKRGQMSESRAVETCRMWLYDNPKRIYGV